MAVGRDAYRSWCLRHTTSMVKLFFGHSPWFHGQAAAYEKGEKFSTKPTTRRETRELWPLDRDQLLSGSLPNGHFSRVSRQLQATSRTFTLSSYLCKNRWKICTCNNINYLLMLLLLQTFHCFLSKYLRLVSRSFLIFHCDFHVKEILKQ